MERFFDLVTVCVFTTVLAYAFWLWYKPRLVAKVTEETTRLCHRVFISALQQHALESLAQVSAGNPGPRLVPDETN